MKSRLSFILLSVILSNQIAFASDETSSHKGFAGNIGASLEAGKLENSGMDLSSRTMTAVSIEGLLGYRLNEKWILGVDANYRIQQQQTKVSEVSNTNLAGKGWLAGLGLQYRINDLWAVQAAMDFFGVYDFDKQTSTSKDDQLEKPLSLRLKAQYFLKPSWSVDGSVNYIKWSTFHVGGIDHSEDSKQWMIGAGMTYHFGESESAASNSSTTAATTTATATDPEKSVETPAVAENAKAKDLQIDLEGSYFPPYSSKISPALSKKIDELAVDLKNNPDKKVLIKGYTDTSGSLAQNKKISKARAEAVKKALIKKGINKNRIATEGLGPENPAFDNSTAQGRSQNRRIEIEKGN